jgi:hypothetical protein
MTGAYYIRLACLSLAAYFVIQLATGLLARALAHRLPAMGLRPRESARALLLLRWLPTLFALALVTAVCIPAYLRFEPGESGEELGLGCLLGALSTLALWFGAALRGVSQVRRSRSRLREGSASGPMIAVAGFFRPRLLLSHQVVTLLTHEQLDAAVLHERAHADAFDNLKRLLLAFTPGLLPGVRGFTALERQWARFTELAADDDAVAGDPHRALALASALVRVARLGVNPAPLTSSLLDGDGLTERVERLLHPAPYEHSYRGMIPALALAGTAALCASGWALRPEALQSAHQLLEHLVR